MPAVLVVGGAYAAYGATGWALFAAGTMVVSGVMARKAQIDGDKKNESNWMLIGSVAGIGATMLPGNAAANAANTAGTITADAAPVVAKEGSQTAMLAGQTNSADAVSAMSTNTATTTGTSTAANSAEAYIARSDAKMAEIMSNNLKTQTAGMAIQGYAGYETAQAQKEIEEKKIAAAQALVDEQRSNMNNLTQLTYNKVDFLPNINEGAAKIRKGLINAPTTTQQLTQG